MAALALAGLVALAPAGSAAVEDRLGRGLPLVLKDGRIANVTVHTIPFATGADALDAAAMASLEATFRPLATDCFLTAQAIGHVAPGIARDGDTLAAHRLARARADAIQAMLAGFGMPQPAVASVWDWQFLVQESQVTLWVFSLTIGDDCEGTPLPIEAPALAAVSETLTEAPATTASTARTAADETLSVRSTEAATAPAETPAGAGPRELLVAEAVAQPAADEPVRQAAQPTDLAANGTLPAVEVSPVDDLAASGPGSEMSSAAINVGANAAQQQALQTAEQSTTRPLDPLATAATSQSARSVATGVGATDAPASVAPATLVAAVDGDATPLASDPVAPALVITFDVNSSYFPAGAGPKLRAFLESLPEAQAVQLELAAAVGIGAVRGASGEEAERYNAWMAERRAQRVVEWLEANARGRPITVSERLVENDPSREVRLFATVSP